MERSKAFANFYKTLKQIELYEMEAKRIGHSCDFSTKWKMAEMRCKKYAKILLEQYDWYDIHTEKFIFRQR